MMHVEELVRGYMARGSDVYINILFSLLIPLQDIILPHYYGQLIDGISKHQAVRWRIIIVLVLFILIEFGFMISDWHDIKTISGFQTYTRETVLINQMKLYENHYTEMNAGEIMSKLIKLPQTLVQCYERVKTVIIPYVLLFVGASVYFGLYDSVLGGLVLGAGLLYAITIFFVPQWICPNVASEKDEKINKIHEEIEDLLRNYVAVHGDNEKQVKEVRRLEKFEAAFTEKYAETMHCLMHTKTFMSIIIIAFTSCFIYRCYILLKKKKLDTAAFSSMFLILIYLTHTMMAVEGQMRDMLFDIGIVVESDDMFAPPPALPVSYSGKVDDPILSSGICARHVQFAYRDKVILDDVSFDIKKGETVAIVGDIGSGKSTILKLLLKFNHPNSGSIYLDGKDYRDIGLKELKERIGYVPQQPILFNRSVYENIMYGSDDGKLTEADVDALIQRLGLAKEFESVGMDKPIGKNGSRLSGGQRQVVWCLRTIAQNPEIVIMDEPTASLDEKSKAILNRILEDMMKEKTVILVTHDKQLMEFADRKIYVENGRIRGSSDSTSTINKGVQHEGVDVGVVDDSLMSQWSWL